MNAQEMTMHFVVATDGNYLPHAATVFRSIYETNRQHSLAFHLMTTDPNVKEDSGLKTLFDQIRGERCQCDVILVEKNGPFLAVQPQDGVTPYQAAYLRFLAADLIPAEKILYLDCDTVIVDDLLPLFSTPLGNKVLAVVPELFAGAFIFEQGFGLRYFNSGVMLINAGKWRKDNLTLEAIRFIRDKFSKLSQGKKHYGDQDILNMLFQGQLVYLHPRYNMVNPFFLRKCFFSGKLFEEAWKNPAIIHYAGSAKPWNGWDFHPMAPEYIRYRRMTPWNEIPKQNPDRKQVLRYLFQRLKYHCPWLIYPVADLWRRVMGYPSRKVKGALIEHLMEETKVECSANDQL